ncbi:HEAT repeat domain-containing protein [Streptomyces sp. NPDC087901]|uniref:HEAT repeat domain-containing protein n=1 Tax=Streptomyces sp. NPDC087901 TaxID=3365818 RepID=UPI00382A9D79
MNADGIAALIAQAGHGDPDLRAEAAGELPAAMSGQPDDPALAALIPLTRDREAFVRERATFALGQLAEVDGPDIRSALWRRLDDEDPETREEAVRGLAVRRDPRAVPLLAALLEEPTAYVQTFNAAAVLADPRLLPSLRSYDPADPGVQEALQACDPAAREQRDAAAWALLEAVHALLPAADWALYTSRFETNLTLVLSTAGHDGLTWNADALLARAGGDPERAAALAAEAAEAA